MRKKDSKRNGTLTKKEDRFPHFRKYLKSGHPALIVENYLEDEYKFRKVTSSPKDGRHTNEKLDPNPDTSKSTPMYIGKNVKHDKKKFFSKNKYPWVYTKKDK